MPVSNSSVYELLHKMDAENVVLAYKGEINSELLEAVYGMMGKHMEEQIISPDKSKKFFHVLIESLQNVFHHQVTVPIQVRESDVSVTGFIVTKEGENIYSIVTGNYMLNENIDKLKNKLDEVNSLSPEALRSHYQQALAGSEFSEKGGAGLGIIEMARKSGNKLDYEFTKVNDEYSFFSLAITIP